MKLQHHTHKNLPCVVLILLSTFLASCGFQLRQNSILAQTISQLDVECLGDSWRLCQRLKNQFQIQGLDISGDANFLLKISPLKSNTRALTVTSDASVAEYDLRHQVHYELISKSSDFVLSEKVVKASRLYDHDNKALLSQERQIDELEIGLQKELADKILNQLSLIDINAIRLAESEKE